MLHLRIDYEAIQDARPDGIGQNEPVFVLRAKDPQAAAAVAYWARIANAAGADNELCAKVFRWANYMQRWRDLYGDKSKNTADVPPELLREVPVCDGANKGILPPVRPGNPSGGQPAAACGCDAFLNAQLRTDDAMRLIDQMKMGLGLALGLSVLEIQKSSPLALVNRAMARMFPALAKKSEPEKSETPQDAINPGHYRSHPSGIECINVVESMSFSVGNAVKYLWRSGLKSSNPVEDLTKACWYIAREIIRLGGTLDKSKLP